jgi:hypothetical protein
MNDKLKALAAAKKKEGKKLSPVEKEAKGSVLKDLRDMASGAMAKKVKGIKKVEVASNSEEGLEAGLEKAKEILGKSPESEEEEMPMEHEEECDTVEEIDSKIQELLAKKKELEAEEQE